MNGFGFSGDHSKIKKIYFINEGFDAFTSGFRKKYQVL